MLEAIRIIQQITIRTLGVSVKMNANALKPSFQFCSKGWRNPGWLLSFCRISAKPSTKRSLISSARSSQMATRASLCACFLSLVHSIFAAVSNNSHYVPAGETCTTAPPSGYEEEGPCDSVFGKTQQDVLGWINGGGDHGI